MPIAKSAWKDKSEWIRIHYYTYPSTPIIAIDCNQSGTSQDQLF